MKFLPSFIVTKYNEGLDRDFTLISFIFVLLI